MRRSLFTAAALLTAGLSTAEAQKASAKPASSPAAKPAAKAVAPPVTPWRAQEIGRIGVPQGVAFGRVTSMVPAADGRLFVLDGQAASIYIFAADGRKLHRFGIAGSGPGQIGAFTSDLMLTNKGQIALMDHSNQRISLFKGDGSFVRSRTVNLMHGTPAGLTASGDRILLLLAPLPETPASMLGGVTQHTLLSLNPMNDAKPDTLLKARLPQSMTMVMSPKPKLTINMRVPDLLLVGDNNGRAFIARSDTYNIRVMTAGKTSGFIRRDARRTPLKPQEIAAARARTEVRINEGFDASNTKEGPAARPAFDFVLPQFAPIMSGVFAGAQYVLVNRTNPIADVPGPATLDVLSTAGKFLGQVTLPAGSIPRAVAGDRLYAVAKDAAGRNAIVVYRIAPAR